MIKIYGEVLVLLDCVRACEHWADAGGIDGATRVSDERYDNFRATLTGTIAEYCKNFEITEALNRIARIELLMSSVLDCTHENFRYQFRTLRENIEDDLKRRWFLYIERDRAEVLSKITDIPFKHGPDLPRARYEWYEAVHCYGFERYTACIVHLMRLAEIALQTLAREFVGDEVAGREIEFLDWKPLLAIVEPALETKLKQLEQEQRTAKRESNVNFYTDARSHLRYFKTLRDSVAHARNKYDQGQCLSGMKRIEEFMTLLADRT